MNAVLTDVLAVAAHEAQKKTSDATLQGLKTVAQVPAELAIRILGAHNADYFTQAPWITKEYPLDLAGRTLEHGRYALSSDGMVAAKEDRGNVRLWRIVEDRAERGREFSLLQGSADALALNSDGSRLAAFDRTNHRITLWSTVTGQLERELPSPIQAAIFAKLAFFAHDSALALEADGDYALMDLVHNQSLIGQQAKQSLRGTSARIWGGTSAYLGLNGVTVSADGRHMVSEKGRSLIFRDPVRLELLGVAPERRLIQEFPMAAYASSEEIRALHVTNAGSITAFISNAQRARIMKTYKPVLLPAYYSRYADLPQELLAYMLTMHKTYMPAATVSFSQLAQFINGISSKQEEITTASELQAIYLSMPAPEREQLRKYFGIVS